MTNRNVLRILNTLYLNLPVTLNGREYYLGTDRNLGVKMSQEVNGILVPNVDQNGDPLIYVIDWSLKDFLTVCEALPDREIDICVEENSEGSDKSKKGYEYKIKAHKYLFKYAEYLSSNTRMLNRIIQNDNVISLNELKNWVKEITLIIYKLLDYAEDVIQYVKYNKAPKDDIV